MCIRDSLQAVYEEGRSDGYRNGWDKGYRDGYRGAWEEAWETCGLVQYLRKTDVEEVSEE